MKIEVLPIPPAELKAKPTDETNLGFGRVFCDRMFIMEYEGGRWKNARIQQFGNLSLSPAAICLHYAQEIFEGLKAYRTEDERILLFRPEANIARMNRSAERLCMPQVDPDIFMEAMKTLVDLERDWVPRKHEASLYIRPTLIGVDPFLGVRPADNFLFYIIAGPVGAYYPRGFTPVKIMVSDKYVRAVRGGIGAAKAGANYAASLAGQMEAKKQGFDQVLWLDGVYLKYVEEVGTMNMVFILGDRAVTASLDNGTILPGVTRDSVLRLLRDKHKLRVEERSLSIEEVIEGCLTGNLKEAFGTGTAAVISAVGEIGFHGERYKVGDGGIGPIARGLYEELLGVQYGARPDVYGWTVQV